MANENSKPQVQTIPLAKIHDLPGVFISKQPDKTYGGLVTSIQTGGVKEPVILRLREDGEYQLVTGYRRRRASELANKQDIPALVYNMTAQEAIDYHNRVQKQPDLPVPGKLVEPIAQGEKTQKPDVKGPGNPTVEDKLKETTAAKDGPAAAPAKEDKEQPPAPKATDKPTAPAAGDKPKEAVTVKDDPAVAPAKEGKDQTPGPKATDNPTAPAAGDKSKETTAAKDGPAAAPAKDGKDQTPGPKAADKPTTPAAGDKSKETTAAKDGPAAAPAKDGKDQAPAPKTADKPTVPAPGDKTKETPTVKDGPAAASAKDGKEQAPGPKATDKPTVPTTGDKAKETTTAKDTPAATPKPAEKPAVIGPAAKGPAGTAISQVFDERLSPPDEKALKNLPAPKEGESFFITLHPAYLEKSQFNVFSVDQSSENFQELKKSVELVGIKDPVLARLKPEGGLEILSDQRRHLAASALNYPVPTIIQKIDDADAKIIVADGNLHRDKISTYDLSRALRMKMEGMKQKSGRRKKGTFKAEELDSDEKLALEMGMKVSKLNRIIRLSEATKDVCARVDDGSLHLSIASALSFLKPASQDEALHLMDIGYKLTNDRVERMKKADKAGKLDEMTMRNILEDKDLAPKLPPTPPPPPAQQTSPVMGGQTSTLQGGPVAAPSIPASPDVKPTQAPTSETPPVIPFPDATTPAPSAPSEPSVPAPAAEPGPAVQPNAPAASDSAAGPAKEDEPFKGVQERPEITKVILTGDRLRKYFPDVSMTPREIEESVYDALEERRQRQIKAQQKDAIFQKGKGQTR